MNRLKNIFEGGLHRSRDGLLLGVCKGMAEYFDFSVFWTRAVAVLAFLMSGFWPVTGIYFLAALLMKPKPVIPIQTDDEQEFYDSYVHSRKAAVHRIKKRFDGLEHRLRRLEDSVTSHEFDWERRFNT